MTLEKLSGCNAAHLKGDDFMQLFIFGIFMYIYVGSTNAFYNVVFATLATFMYGFFLSTMFIHHNTPLV